MLDRHLEQSDWLLGENFSLVDCCYGPVLDAFALAGTYIEAYPAIQRYLRTIRARKAWRACEFQS